MDKTRRHGFLRAALVAFGAAGLVALSCYLAGCRETPQATRDYFPPANVTTPHGVPVTLPGFVMAGAVATPTGTAYSLDDVLSEIDAADIPPGWSIVVRVAVFETDHSPTGIARGLTHYEERVVEVGWRVSACEDRPLLPALTWERDNAVFGPSHDPTPDPTAH